MSPEGFSYQREGCPPGQAQFVTQQQQQQQQQQQSWPEGASFPAPVHPQQTVHFAGNSGFAHDDGSRPVSSAEMAWSGFRPGSQGHVVHHHVQGHNPFCQQHGKPEGEPVMPGHGCVCPQHHHHHHHHPAVPPTVPTPPPSDGSPNPGWVSMISPGDPDAQHVAKRMKYDWNFDNNTPVVRPDGVRKKNAKFEIPDDRNLDTLDTLIKHAKSEGELKELKMQKRLLRNREAALHSRQKKKSHTEWLERERDTLSNRLYHIQHELTSLHIRVDDHEREKSSWQDRLTKADQQVTTIQHEKDVLMEQHSRETRKLSQEIIRLREQVQAAQSTTASPTSTNPGSATFSSSDDNVNFSHASSFETSDWDFINDGCLDPGKLRHSNEPSGADILVH